MNTLTADVDRQLTLLRLAARVDPNLRQAVADVEDTIAALRTQLEQAQAAILDIDAHAAPMGKDADGFVTVGYVVSVGSLHRALGKVGRTSPKCSTERPCPTCAREAALEQALEELVGAHDHWFDTGMGEGRAIAATAKAKELLGEH